MGETERAREWVREMRGRSERDAYVCLNFYLSVEGGEWEGLSIIPNHLYSAAHITSPRLGVGESRLICIRKSNCWKAVRANKIYGCIDVYIWCFCSVWGAEDKCAYTFCVCGDRCNLTAMHEKKKKAFLTTSVLLLLHFLVALHLPSNATVRIIYCNIWTVS